MIEGSVTSIRSVPPFISPPGLGKNMGRAKEGVARAARKKRNTEFKVDE
jgi:hypothetical protein